ncbi:DUF4097 domain-containing protein [Brevibacillus sp. M2.1A]|uniref:DUF4097 family beta strand repeat-containing protein n=1 Tax=Brevibacillus TaxID=55080 RepID=UPI00156B7B4D|nr:MULTISPECIES: DUF4097 family beta strand repeat-containing protein [Brevibacillus]MBY0089106.1 DUF4097 family beta strand repeat protein [Brevibacillus brevis]MCC8435284.1 DUF4097 domain-containing protein [Brevibacillus sp. M2.1A]MCE0451867.1 DUF4097 family beta strand repeat protein [Brevibacillus sp. AF8]UKK97651.1 DUF4097 domain-containing protein [Brevibacillus brevis]
MRNLGKRLFGISLLLFIIGVCGIIWLFTKQENFSFSLKQVNEEHVIEQEVKAIELLTEAADVEIMASKQPKASVRMVGEVSEQQQERLEFRSVVSPDGTLLVELRELPHVNMFYPRNGKVKLEVFLPEKVYENVQLETMTGDIKSGMLRAKNTKISTGNGDVNVSGYEGEALNVQTATGDINLEDVRSAVVIESSTGEIDKLTMPELTHDVSIRTDTGDIRVTVAKEPAAAQLEVTTDTGSISTTWSNLIYEKDEEYRVKASIGSGGPKMTVRSSTGDVRIQ